VAGQRQRAQAAADGARRGVHQRGHQRDWTDLAGSIDERLTQGPDWPALSSALDRAAASGYDVETNLPRLAARDDLPKRHPARDLQYRLLADCDSALPPPTPAADPLIAAARDVHPS